MLLGAYRQGRTDKNIVKQYVGAFQRHQFLHNVSFLARCYMLTVVNRFHESRVAGFDVLAQRCATISISIHSK